MKKLKKAFKIFSLILLTVMSLSFTSFASNVGVNYDLQANETFHDVSQSLDNVSPSINNMLIDSNESGKITIIIILSIAIIATSIIAIVYITKDHRKD